MEKTILIASSTPSQEEYTSVAQELTSGGYNVVIYNSDRVMRGEEQLFLDISPEGLVTILHEGVSISPDSLSAAWYRKVGDFDPKYLINDKARQLLVQDEISEFHQTIWSLYPENVWLNAPDRMQQAAKKLSQLLVAREVQFKIPETVISSNWAQIKEKLMQNGGHREIIVKMLRGVIIENDEEKALATTILDEQSIEKLENLTVPFPGMYQPYLKKEREWRVTVVGDEVFSAAIYTDETAKDDWRKHQLNSSVTFMAESPPEGVDAKCIEFLGRMGLRFGAFDFVETPDGEIIFLECNANGQYYWLEKALKLPISKAITGEILKIARTN